MGVLGPRSDRDDRGKGGRDRGSARSSPYEMMSAKGKGKGWEEMWGGKGPADMWSMKGCWGMPPEAWMWAGKMGWGGPPGMYEGKGFPPFWGPPPEGGSWDDWAGKGPPRGGDSPGWGRPGPYDGPGRGRRGRDDEEDDRGRGGSRSTDPAMREQWERYWGMARGDGGRGDMKSSRSGFDDDKDGRSKRDDSGGGRDWGDWGSRSGSAWGSNQRGSGRRSPPPTRSSGDSEKDELIARVKQVQRSGMEAKELWYHYCDSLGTGNRDPSRHSKDSLRNFLTAYDRGEAPEVPASLAAGNSPVLRLRGVPFQSDFGDVVQFLIEYGVMEKDVAFGRSPEGKKTGEAYVTFASPDIAERALREKQRQEIHGRYIELFRSNFEEKETATGHVGPEMETKEDLVTQVKSIQRGGQAGRDAWEKYCDALRTGNRDPLRHTVESMRNFLDAWKKGEDPEELARRVGATRVVRLRGVPFQAQVSEVVEFLAAYQVSDSQVHLVRNREGKLAGEAYVVFPSEPLAERALNEMQRQEIRGRYIELFRASESEMADALRDTWAWQADPMAAAAPEGAGAPPPGGDPRLGQPPPMGAVPAEWEQLVSTAYPDLGGGGGGGLPPFSACYPTGATFPTDGAGFGPMPRAASPPGGGADPEKEELVSMVKQVQRSGPSAKEMWYRYCDNLGTGNRDPSRHAKESLKNFLDAVHRGEAPEVPASLAAGNSQVLRLRGVPFQCDVPEVVEFLADYQVEPQHVGFARSPEGKKTGEAYVTFQSPQVAERALREKQRQEIQGRYIELFRSCAEEKEAACGIPLPEHNEKDRLVQQVKNIQRGGQGGRDAWERYCDAMRTGNRDPLRHTAESMRNFVEAYNRGESPEELAARLGGTRVVRLRGVPFQSDVADVVEFLQGYWVDETQVHLVRNADGKMAGEAYVVLPNEQLAEKALNELQRKEIRGRYIELFRSSEAEMLDALTSPTPAPSRSRAASPRPARSGASPEPAGRGARGAGGPWSSPDPKGWPEGVSPADAWGKAAAAWGKGMPMMMMGGWPGCWGWPPGPGMGMEGWGKGMPPGMDLWGKGPPPWA